ncbi:hypothetical protein [Streptomyces sp. NPDC050560]|uniref:hypothetical protein n=1 Tax=Streptomyces sp. NPDC050560 TaxID=3365630 RepID=UPI0037A847B2
MDAPHCPRDERTELDTSAAALAPAYRTGAAAAWLARAHRRPAEVHAAWAHPYGVAALPCGVLYTAVRLPDPVVRAALGTDDLAAVHAALAATLHGPVFRDPADARHYALVPPGTTETWRLPDVECLGPEYYLGVPNPAAVRPSGMSGYWAVPMDGPGHLCDPVAVEELARLGRERVRPGQCAGATGTTATPTAPSWCRSPSRARRTAAACTPARTAARCTA